MSAGPARAGPSVRARLALWHAAFLGALVLALAAAGVWSVERALRARVDEELAETAQLVAGSLAARGAAEAAAAGDGAALREVRGGRLDVLLVDPAARRVVAAHPAVRPARRGPPRPRPAGPPETAAAAPPPPPDSEVWRALLAASADGPAGRPGAAADTAPFTVRDAGGVERRVLVRPVAPAPGGALGTAPGAAAGGAGGLLLVVARDLADVSGLVARLRRDALLALAVAVPVAVAFGWVLARRSLAPVLAMSAQAERLGAALGGPAGAGFAGRLPARNPGDELGRLAAVFNALLDRLADALQQQRQFMADASHELRTPAAVVRSAADVALRRADRSAAEYREALEIAQTEAERMTRLVDDLFLLARADAAQPALRVDDFYLAETLAECARALRPAAEARGVRLAEAYAAPDDAAEAGGTPPDGASLGGAPLDGAPCRGDEALVRRLVLNLLENALRFTPAGGAVTLRLAGDELARDPARRDPLGGPAAVRPAWRVEVEDTGPGVPAALRERIFERFFHSDAHAPAASAAERGAAGRSGAGLGLAMARVIAEAHGGRLLLARSDAAGSLFVLVLPQDGPG